MTAGQDCIIISSHRPGLKEKFFFLTSGVVMSVPLTLLTEQMSFSFIDLKLPVLLATLVSVAVIAPFIEEFAKVYPLFYRHGETERSIFTLGLLAGLGFGIAEFFTYILVYSAPILIRLPGLLFHATNTSITAYGITVKKSVMYYLIAVAFHSLFNLSILSGSFWTIGAGIALSASFSISWHLHDKTKEKIIEFNS